MNHAPPGYPDHFEIVNGPEDGTRFPVNRSPVDIGADGSCAIFIAIDGNVARTHARVSVVSDGYRVRRLPGAGPVHVNGRRAGRLRSRIVRHGGTVRVGDTELCLIAAPEGLASRSYGLPLESDAAWTLRLLGGKLLMFLGLIRVAVAGVFRLARRHWIISLGAVGFLYWARPDLFWSAAYSIRYWLEWARWQLGG